jgi:hypothetical protein
MHLGTHHRSSSRLATRILLVVALAVASVALTQSRMVCVRLSGVMVSPMRASSSCLRACKDKRRDDLKAEDRLHRQQLHDCDRNASCIEQENARHEAAVAAIEAAYQECLNNCHTQGGGRNDD